MGTVTPHAAGRNPTIQVDTLFSFDRAILVHTNGGGILHVTDE
ncbi:hypothetical protein [Sorangium sp. So ce1097]